MASTTTGVDTSALTGAAATTSRLSEEVATAAGRFGPALARLSADLAGSRSAAEVTALRQVSDGVLGDLGRTLARLSALLRVAALDYADAEESVTGAVGSRRGAP